MLTPIDSWVDAAASPRSFGGRRPAQARTGARQSCSGCVAYIVHSAIGAREIDAIFVFYDADSFGLVGYDTEDGSRRCVGAQVDADSMGEARYAMYGRSVIVKAHAMGPDNEEQHRTFHCPHDWGVDVEMTTVVRGLTCHNIKPRARASVDSRLIITETITIKK